MAERQLRRLLVANRGEIARRVIRGAHDAGLEAVAVYTADDAASLLTSGKRTQRCCCPGTIPGPDVPQPSAPGRRGPAVRGPTRCIPGYGFLSENPALADACGEAGLVWVGPTPEAMRIMGHKARAKETVSAAGVPVLPSAVLEPRLITEDDQLGRAAESVGFPLLVKASAGGGGRGMRLVEQPDELGEAVAAARREAASRLRLR